MTAPDDVVEARAAWSRLAEPGDTVAGALVGLLGPVPALGWLRDAGGDPERAVAGIGEVSSGDRRRLVAAVHRWLPRLEVLDTARDRDLLDRLGGTLLVPEDPRWPLGLVDLGVAAPHCLWVRGRPDVAPWLERSVAVIGARACTAYGEHATGLVVTGLADAGWAVVSGGAYGIDAVAHRVALAAEGPTIAFLAGGVDRLYPAGNSRLLTAVVESGSVISEVPPGCAPVRSRFLQRNRLIAAASRATIVVEAAWRSGALNTASHAAGLLRPVGAVPGPITSAASAGCHRLLRDGLAVCVTDAAEVRDLAGAVGGDLAVEPTVPVRPEDGLDGAPARVLDALPVSRAAGPEAIARAAGLSVDETRAALGRLELAGLARVDADRWSRAR